MTKRLTEVARKAGVSEATVSRVLNGCGGVSEATRAAVLTALDVLGYRNVASAAPFRAGVKARAGRAAKARAVP